MFEQSYSFSFEAAHELAANVADKDGHPYAHVHGHSFVVTMVLSAETLGEKAWVEDFAAIQRVCEQLHARLDHRFLNQIEGLERPTLEVMARWIFDKAAPDLPALSAVEVQRPTLYQKVRYSNTRPR